MTDITVSHRNIPSIIDAINTTITAYLSDKQESEQIQWRQTWTKWTSHPTTPFTSINNRKRLAEVIFSNDNDKYQTKTILAKMLEAIPILSDVYEIISLPKSTPRFCSKNVSNIQPSSAQTVLAPTTGTQDPSEDWSTVTKTTKHSSPSRSVNKQPIPASSVSNRNHFEIFAQDEDTGENTSNKEGHSNENNTPTVSNDSVVVNELTEPAEATETNDEKEPESNSKEIIEITNSPDLSQKSTDSDDNNISSITETKVTELTELINVLHQNDLDINEVVNWIKHGDAPNYKEAIAVNLTNLVEEGSKVEEKFRTRLQTITSNLIQMLQAEYNVHKSAMEQNVTRFNKDFATTKQSCQSLLNECNRKVATLSTQIETEQADAIIHISNKSNSALKRLDDTIVIINDKIATFNSAQKFAQSHHHEMNRLQQHMNSTIKSSYEEFSNKINQYADDEKQEFLDFLSNHDDTVAQANSERNLLEEKRRLLDMEKELMEKNQNQIDNKNISAVQNDIEMTIIKDEIAQLRTQVTAIDELKSENKRLAGELSTLQSNVNHEVRMRITQSEDKMKDEHRDEIMIMHKKITELEEQLKAQPSQQFCQPASSSTKMAQPPTTFSSRPTTNPNPTFQPPFFKIGQEVHYKMGKTQLDGYITEREFDNNIDMWVYTISTTHGGTMNSCYEINILSKEAHKSTYVTPLPQARSNKSSYTNLHPPKFEDDNGTPRGYDDDTSHSVTEIKLAENQFLYPLGTANKRSIYYSQISRYADKWKFELKDKHDLFTFYEQLVGLLWEYNILLKPYHEITLNTGIEIITATNCLNFENARKAMTTALFNFFDNNKETIFKDYSEPLALLPAFRSDSDGLGFLKYILRPIHPSLKDVTDTTEHERPLFKDCPNIHSFINRYKHWLADEKILGRPHYTDLEKLKYILNQLDDRFSTAKSKIQTQLNDVYANRHRPGKFPPHLKLDSKLNHLGLTIIELLPLEERHNFNNTVNSPQINKMQTRSNGGNMRDTRREYRRNDRYNQRKNTSHEWAKEIKWKRIPGAICPACHRKDHNVYETGCATLATFCACQDFIRQHTKEEIKPVLEAYNSYIRDLATKKRNVKQSYRKIIRKLVDKATDDEAIDDIKDEFFQNYIEQFEDEQDNPNPFLDIDKEAANDDIGDNDDDVEQLEY